MTPSHPLKESKTLQSLNGSRQKTVKNKHIIFALERLQILFTADRPRGGRMSVKMPADPSARLLAELIIVGDEVGFGQKIEQQMRHGKVEDIPVLPFFTEI